jgi:hypothetical protein
MPILFAGTLFLSAALLFLIQPMFAKMILPRLGGSPAIWNTCMAFFQAGLLLGYVYAHVATTWLGLRRQAVIHLGVLLLPLLTLPVAVSQNWVPPADANPVPGLLRLLLVSVGLPFFVLSSSAPLLQKWFTGDGHPGSRDPYYLYAASNLGSLLALLAYPFLIEPHWPLPQQARWWAAGYGLWVVLLALYAARVWRSAASATGSVVAAREKADATSPPPSAGSRLRWVALAFIPSSWMLGVTTFLSTDVSAFPLLWIAPLSLYLLTFILAFSCLPSWVHRSLCWLLPVAILIQIFLMLSGITEKLGVVVPLHLLTFLVAALVCHGELARSRPLPAYLTELYLWLAVGGVGGGMFNALLAPQLFGSVAEYPLAMVLACFLVPPLYPERQRRWQRLFDLALPVCLGLFTLYWLFQWGRASSMPFQEWLTGQAQGAETSSGLGASVPRVGTLRLLWLWAPPVAMGLTLCTRPVRFGLGLGALFLASQLYRAQESPYVLQERNFFGVVRVERAGQGRAVKSTHGSTLHGAQFRSRDPRLRVLPLLYYFPSGPIGQVFFHLEARESRQPVGVIGLGAGTMALYAQPDQEFVFFEIDPAVVRVARDPKHFTYLAECQGAARVVLGDARLSLAREPDGHFGLIVVDAFSSDAIPVHLLTREALQLYLKKLTPDGILAFHISSKYLDLEPVLASLARAENLVCLVQHDEETNRNELERHGKFPSDWVILARHTKDFGELASDWALTVLGASTMGGTGSPLEPLPFLAAAVLLPGTTHYRRWHPAVPRPGQAVWTDDFSNVLSALRWWQ